MRLSRLTQSRPTEATIDVLGDDIKVTYDRSLINRAFFNDASGATINEKLSKILISWDVTDDDGLRYEPAVGSDWPVAWLALFAPIPDDILRAVYRGILDDFYVGNPLGAAS